MDVLGTAGSIMGRRKEKLLTRAVLQTAYTRKRESASICLKQLARESSANDLFVITGERRQAAVPDGERANAADRSGSSGLCDRESPVHPQ